jgi:transaldolase
MEYCQNKIKIFYDGINIEQFSKEKYIKGFTTNPSILSNLSQSELPKKYSELTSDFLKYTKDLPISLEVFADDIDEMINQGILINNWSPNIYVKIPIINSKGLSTENAIKILNRLNIKLNITAIFTEEQANIAYNSIENKKISSIISIFSGRIADTGINPISLCQYTVNLCKNSNIEVLWASTREVYNIFQAIDCGCHIITIPDDVLKRIKYIGKDLNEYSKETVETFVKDSKKSNIIF